MYRGVFMQENKGFLYQVVSGILLTVAAALFFSVIFSLIATACSLSNSVINPVNQFIKTVAVFFGCFFRLRGKAGLIKGMIIGVFSELIILLIFSLFYGLPVDFSWLIDLAFCTVLGLIFGILAVNVKKDD